MKVLYINNYRDGTGWANAGINNMLALDAAGVDVVPRAITFNDKDGGYPERLRELEVKHAKRSSNVDCDVVVQHTLPHLYSYDNNYKNIGFLAVESYDFGKTNWQRHINLMDELWVPNKQSAETAKRSGVKIPIKVVPHSLDMNSYQNTEGSKIKELETTFTFGFAGEFVERKNIKALVKAFHMEFNPREPVTLLLKTSKTTLEEVQVYCNTIKKGLKLRNAYKEETVVVGMMEHRDYVSVMSQINCFVVPSRGEAFCIPALECMALGIPTIYTEDTGVDYAVGHSVPSQWEPCFGAVDTLPNLDTSDTKWKEIDILKLAQTMRMVYNKYEEDPQYLKDECIAKSKHFDHSIVGQHMKELLNDG
jgi:glycosyltransferase involved in cell wall biosynthesis